MNDIRIINYVDELFIEVKQTDKVLKRKEQLKANMTELVKGYMSKSLNFDDAFEAAKNDLGDVDELVAGFEKKPKKGWVHETDSPTIEHWKIIALSPFIYVMLGFAFGWWAWAWVIIPLSGIYFSPIPPNVKLISITPFIYVLLGFAFGLWAWGWVIIPVTAILFSNKNL